MARPKRRAAAASKPAEENGPPAADKIARLLALIVTKDMDTDDAAVKLDSVGFGAREISDLLGVGPSYVRVAKHRNKRRGSKKSQKRD